MGAGRSVRVLFAVPWARSMAAEMKYKDLKILWRYNEQDLGVG